MDCTVCHGIGLVVTDQEGRIEVMDYPHCVRWEPATEADEPIFVRVAGGDDDES